MKRAYALLELKAVNEDERIIEGIASTPSADLAGDVVEPKGAEFKLPLPLLYQHNPHEPIGHVLSAKVTAKGIEIRAQIARVTEPGVLKDRLDEAWQSIKARLVRGLSIGFKPLESARIGDTYSYRYLKWLWLELSAVTIPMNTEATIQSVKSFDQTQRAAFGAPSGSVVRLEHRPGVSGAKPKPQEKAMKKTIKEQIAAFEAQRVEKTTRMEAIMQKSAEEGVTLDDAQSEEYDTLKGEVATIDKHLERLREHETLIVEKAAPVVPSAGASQQGAAAARGGAVITMRSTLPPGIEFARYAMCLASANGNRFEAAEIAKQRYPDQQRIHNVLRAGITATHLKAAVDAGTTTDTTWAAPLVQYQDFAGDFVEFLRPQTILGKFGTGNIPSLRRIPFNVRIKSQTSGGSAYWVGEGKPKPLTNFDFDDTELRWAKVANIAVITEELARFSSPSAEMLVRDALAAAIIERLDIDFIDPDKAVSANVSPASVTNGVTAVTSSGNDAAAIREDVKALLQGFIDANIPLSSGVWIMSATTALALSLMRNELGQKEFPDITMLGGSFEGLPVIVSQHVPYPTAGGLVILVAAQEVWLADDGQVAVDVSREASLEMSDTPSHTSNPASGTQLVSLWQTNSIGLKAERFINWQKRRSAGVGYIENVLWGTPASA